MSRGDGSDPDLDLVLAILALVKMAVPELTPEKASDVEQQARERYGGMRARIAKRKKHPTPEQRKKIVDEALSPGKRATSTNEIATAAGIGRATLYRYLKKPG